MATRFKWTLIIIFMVAGTLAARAETLTLSAAISLKDALTQIATTYESHAGDKVRLNVGASGQLMEQIKNGAPVDLFISAGPGQVEDLDKAGLTVPASRRVVARNRLVLIIPAGKVGIAGFEDLTKADVKRIAVGKPKVVPAGDYAAEAFDHFKIADSLKGKLIYGANVRQVLDYVRRGEVDAGVVYATDAAEAGADVKVAAVAPEDAHEPIEYVGIVLKGAAHRDSAEKFLSYLDTDDARRVLEAKGFVVGAKAK